MPDGHVVVIGGGLAGLVAAATVREYGVDVELHEAAPAPGGASIESAGWVWRYRDAGAAARGARTASPVVSRLVLERLDEELRWLVALGVVPLATSTGRADTIGMRIDPRDAIERLSATVGADAIVTSSRVTSVDAGAAVILAAGGYGADFARIAAECGAPRRVADAWVRRPVSASRGDGVDLGLAAGGSRPNADGHCLVRISVEHQDGVRDLLSAVSELLVDGVVLTSSDGAPISAEGGGWSHAGLLRRFQVEHGAGTLEIPARLLDQRVHAGAIRDILEALDRASDAVVWNANGGARVAVRAGITHTWCGLDVDADSRVIGAGGTVFAAGCDAAGSGHGGTASGLAQALVLGRRAGAAAARAVLQRT